MTQIILDLGSGNTCHNDWDIMKRMMDSVAEVDTKRHEIIFKWQLFTDEPPNERLQLPMFWQAYEYAKKIGYKTTASVFDTRSLYQLLELEVPFIKIACRKTLWHLIGLIPRKIPVYASSNRDIGFPPIQGGCNLYCIPKYPADMEEYGGYNNQQYNGISDHTVGPNLWFKYQPAIWEKHYVLKYDKSNPDGGPWAMDQKQLKEVIG